MNEPVIVLNELTKSYGRHRGVEGISFSVCQGEIFGFIGPNGAGKSTTIRALMGLLKPTSGSASIFGLDCSQEPARIACGVSPQRKLLLQQYESERNAPLHGGTIWRGRSPPNGRISGAV